MYYYQEQEKEFVNNLTNLAIMKIEEFEKLLTEFYEGNTTESQEETLREYFENSWTPGER